jgi:hypothetical protein
MSTNKDNESFTLALTWFFGIVSLIAFVITLIPLFKDSNSYKSIEVPIVSTTLLLVFAVFIMLVVYNKIRFVNLIGTIPVLYSCFYLIFFLGILLLDYFLDLEFFLRINPDGSKSFKGIVMFHFLLITGIIYLFALLLRIRKERNIYKNEFDDAMSILNQAHN